MASCLFVGLLFQDLAALLRPMVFPFAVVTMLLSLVRIDWGQALAYLSRPTLPLAVICGALLASPLLVAAIAGALVDDPAVATGMVLIAASPPLAAAPAYAILIGLDAALAMVVALPATLLAPLTMPPLLLFAVGIALELDIAAFAARLGIMVGLAFLGAFLLRALFTQAEIDARGRYFDAGVVLFISAFGIGVMDGIARVVAADPLKSLAYCAAAFALNLGLQLIGFVASLALGKRRALTVGLVLGNRNAILVTGAVAAAAGPDLMLYLIASQLPLYLMPMILRPVCGRVLRGARHGRRATVAGVKKSGTATPS